MENSLKTFNSCNYNLGAFPLLGGGTDSSKTLFSPATSIERERCHVSDREGREGANFYSQVVVLIMQLQNLACKIMLIIIISMQIFSKKTKFSKNYKKILRNFKYF